MAGAFISSIASPMGWIATSGAVLFGLYHAAPSAGACIAGAATLSAAIVFIVSRLSDRQGRFLVPFLGAALFSFMTWIAILLVPGSSAEIGAATDAVFMARVLVALSAVLMLMPVLAAAETLISVVFVQAIARSRSSSPLGGELRVASMLDRKFGGLLGTLNR